MKQRSIEWFLLIILLGSAFFLHLCNLSNQYLWQDEAETALISKTILAQGIPMCYDGKNYFSQLKGADFTADHVWIWHPWLQFYVCAAFFGIFGVSTFVARLPFAIFGIASVFMTYVFCKTMWQSRKIAATAAFLLLVCVPFLILSRQCRYYSMTAFFSLTGLYAYLGMLEKKKYSFILFVLSAALLFYTHYTYCATLLAAVGLHLLIFHRNRFWILVKAVVIIALISTPWAIWLLSQKPGGYYGTPFRKSGQLVETALIYLHDIGKYIFSPYLLLVIPLIILGNRIRTGLFFLPNNKLLRQKILLLLLFIFFNIVASTIVRPGPFFRYLMPTIPVFTIITALLIVAAARLHFIFAFSIMIVLILTGSLKDFLYEVTHNYDGPIEGIVKYLNANGTQEDIVVITSEDLPLKFYTSMRILNDATGEDLSEITQANWVILRNYAITQGDIRFGEYLMENIPWENYEPITIDYPDIPFENREDPAKHHFRTVTDENRVVIWRKIR